MSLSALDALRPGLTALNDFSSILTNAIEAIDGNVVSLRGLNDETLNKLLAVDNIVTSHEQRLKLLENESATQREVAERAMKTAASVERTIGSQLDDATRNLHKEMVIQRTMTKMDISSLRGKLSQSMSEVLSTLMNPQKTYKDSMPVYNPNFTTAESIQYLIEKVNKIDEAIGLQHTVNQHLTDAITNEEMIQRVYDSLFEQVNQLHSELEESKKENNHLRNTIQSMKTSQNRQERLVYDILDALSSKEKLKQLRSDMKHDPYYRPGEEEDGEMDRPAVDGDGEFIRKRSPSHYSHRGHRSRKKRSYEVQLHQIHESTPDAEELEEIPTTTTDEHKEGVDIEGKPVSRKGPITARFSTLVRREIPSKKNNKHYIRKPRFAKDQEGHDSTIHESEEEDESEEETEADKEGGDEKEKQKKPKSAEKRKRQKAIRKREKDSTKEGEEETERDMEGEEEDEEEEEGEENPEMEKPKSAGKKRSSPTKPSKIIDRMKQIRSHRSMSDDMDDEEDGDDLEDEEVDDAEEEAPANRKLPKTIKKQKVKARAPSPKKVDQRKDTLKSANFYRGDAPDEVIDDQDGEYRPSRLAQQTILPKKATESSRSKRTDEKKEKDQTSSDPLDAEEKTAERDRLDGAVKEEEEEEEGEGPNLRDEDDAQSHLTGESSFFNDGSVSLMNEDSSIGRHVIDVIEANNIETANVINTLRDEYNDRLDTVETTLATFKRIAYAIDDLKIGFEAVRKKVDAISTAESIEEKLAAALYAKIAKAKEQWSRIYSELLFGLENVNPSELDKPNDGSMDDINDDPDEKKTSPFFQRARELSYAIEDALEDFNPRETVDETLQKLIPSLDKIHRLGEQLLAADQQARQSQSLDYCLDDLLCSDLTPSLRMLLLEAHKQSLPILDESISKMTLSRLVQTLQGDLQKKAEWQQLLESELETRRLLTHKVDQQEFIAMTSKLASASEVQRLQQLMNEGHYSGSTAAAAQAMLGGGRTSSGGIDGRDSISIVDQPDFQQLVERFNILANKQYELEIRSNTLVSKEEVHDALKAIVAEIKNLRKNCVLLPIFREGLKSKADVVELEKLVKTITSALGDYNFSADFAASAAAMHAKCLICDKPVSRQQQRGRPGSTPAPPASVPSNLLLSRSMTQVGYDKAEDDTLQKKLLPAPSTLKQVHHPNPAVSKPAKAKVITDMTILKSTIEPLPEINDSLVDSPRMQSVSNSDIQYKQRIRNSAGGGIGPNYKMDTR